MVVTINHHCFMPDQSEQSHYKQEVLLYSSRIIQPQDNHMPHYQIRIDETLPVAVAQAFATAADHQALGRLLAAPVKRIVDGQGDVNGVGSVRQIGPGLIGIQETVTAIDPGKSIHYRITKGGFPMTNHQGVMRFESAGTGCRVQWDIDFDMPPLLGDVVSATLKRVLTQGLRRLR